jgi:hypothetical protein
MHIIFWLENLKGGDHSKDLGVDGRIILERWEGVDWIYLVQDMDQYWALVNMVRDLPLPQKAGNFLTS